MEIRTIAVAPAQVNKNDVCAGESRRDGDNNTRLTPASDSCRDAAKSDIAGSLSRPEVGARDGYGGAAPAAGRGQHGNWDGGLKANYPHLAAPSPPHDHAA